MSASSGGATAGAAAAAAASLPPPELHLQMCKKIALLTKVVYHLNIKSEDRDSALLLQRRQHEEELRRVSDDAAAKIARLTDAVRDNAELRALEAALAESTARYESERAKAQAQAAADELSRRYVSSLGGAWMLWAS